MKSDKTLNGFFHGTTSLLIGAIMATVIVGNSCYVFGQKEQDMIDEELLFQEIPVVVTSSRYEQPITESPSSICVVTEEDIRQSGATSIPDILRMMPGMDVLTITLLDQNVSPRGYGGHMANRTLVMIDGRSVNEDMFGFILWDTIPINLSDVKRIEVVRGPGSALYGANAFSGVINIITKSPQEAKGSLVSVRGGNFDTRIGALVHAGENGKVSYKISLKGESADEWRETRVNKAGESFFETGLISYKFNDDSSFSLSGGRNNFWGGIITSFTDLGSMRKNGWVNYLRADYESGHLKTRVWWKNFYSKSGFIIDTDEVVWNNHTIDSEIQYDLLIGEKNKFIGGINYRRNQIQKNSYLNPEQEDLLSIFIQDEIKATDKFDFFLGGRLDHHPITKYNFSPRGSVVYNLDRDNILRLSASTAYRNPNQVEAYMDKPVFVPMPDALKVIPGAPDYFLLSELGSKELKPAKIESYELAYQTKWSKKVKLDLNLFYNRVNDIIFFGTTQLYNENELFAGLPGGLLPKVQSFFNYGRAEGLGGEIEINVLLASWLKGLANYSYQSYINREDDPTTMLLDEKDSRAGEYPLHKINAGLRANFDNISANLTANYVSDVFVDRVFAEGERIEKVNEYIQVNSRIGYEIKKGLEVAISVFNLLENRHNEFYLGWGPTYPVSDEIGRRITADVTYKF